MQLVFIFFLISRQGVFPGLNSGNSLSEKIPTSFILGLEWWSIFMAHSSCTHLFYLLQWGIFENINKTIGLDLDIGCNLQDLHMFTTFSRPVGGQMLDLKWKVGAIV